MSLVRTDLGETRERARELRFEPVAGIPDTNVQKAIERGGALVATPIAFGNSPYPVTTQTYLFVDTAGGSVEIDLPPSANRGGAPIIIKDGTGHAQANNIHVVPNGAETIDGLNPLLINADFGGWKIAPKTGGGWTLLP